MLLLALETSCDETAVALLDLDRFRAAERGADALRANVLATQAAMHASYGGVVPELAARTHITNLPSLITLACDTAGVRSEDIEACAVTQGPGLKGALLVGLNFAKGFQLSRDLALVPVNHLEGHLWAYELEKRHSQDDPFLALIVSGGHTALFAINRFRAYQKIAATRDDAAGEAFDKIATILELPYPGGPALSRFAIGGDVQRFKFPALLPGDFSSFSFSGLKTSALRLSDDLKSKGEWDSEQVRRDFAASVENAIVNSLIEKTLRALSELKLKRLVVTGGVAANRILRQRFAERLQPLGIALEVPPIEFCTDNAAMIGVVGALCIEQYGIDAYRPNGAATYVGPTDALPRWPLEELGAVSGPRQDVL